jgi:hypothetical protein
MYLDSCLGERSRAGPNGWSRRAEQRAGWAEQTSRARRRGAEARGTKQRAGAEDGAGGGAESEQRTEGRRVGGTEQRRTGASGQEDGRRAGAWMTEAERRPVTRRRIPRSAAPSLIPCKT